MKGVVGVQSDGPPPDKTTLKNPSSLTRVNRSICLPKERQSIATCLRIFCEETYTVIINHLGMRHVDGREETAAFIKIAISWLKILNVNCIGIDVRFNNKLQAVVQDPLDKRLRTILQFGEMALQMKCGQGKRNKQFTQILLRQDITHAMVLLVCADLLSESRIIMFYWKYFQQIH